MGVSAHDVILIAEKYLGISESPANSNRTLFGQWYAVDGEPWCAKYVSYVLDQAGITDYKHKYTPSGADLFKAQDRWVTSLGESGDVAFFDFPGDSLFRISHVGFVTGRDGDYYSTIEGNTSGTEAGSQRDGGGVYRRRRHRSLIVGFGRPPYTDRGSPPAGHILREGSTGRRVLDWQRDLNRIAGAGLEEDGEFGKETRKATIAWQRAAGLNPDGEVGRRTLRKMAKALGALDPEQTVKRARLLKEGDSGVAVRRLQRRLARHGFDLVGTGTFGPKTKAAVTEFQRRQGLEVDGVAGPQTWRALGL